MSKKQREKVEDEVRYHKEINNSQGGGVGNGVSGSGTSPDSTDRNSTSSTVFDPTQQPSSTDPFANTTG